MPNPFALVSWTSPLLMAVAGAQSPPMPHHLPGLADRVLFDQPRAGELWAVGNDWKAGFDADGLTFVPFLGSEAPHDFPLRVQLASVTIGGRDLALSAAAPQRDGDRVCTDRGALLERITTARQWIEQDFVFATLPMRGDIAVELSLRGELVVAADDRGLACTGPLGGVTYHDAKVTDAAGHALALPITWTGERARIVVPADFVATATLPLVLDPVLSMRNGLAPGVAPAQRLPDVATLQVPDRALVCWQRQFSATDNDVYAIEIDGGLANITGQIAVDVTTQNWSLPHVASNANVSAFLVVAQVDAQSSTTWIGGRLVHDGGPVDPAIDIERFGVNFSLGNDFTPDVGGDPDENPSAAFLVVFEKDLGTGQRDIYGRMVSQLGVPDTAAIVLQNTARDERLPTVSKSARYGDWCTCWQTLASPGNHDVEAAHVTWNGNVARNAYTVAATATDETSPAVSSGANVENNGGIFYALVWEANGAGGHDLVGRIVDSFANPYTGFALTALENAGNLAQDQTMPEVESDGTRFVVAYTETSPIQNHDTYATTFAYLPPTDTVRIDDAHSQLGHAVVLDDLFTRIASWAAGPVNWTPLYLIAGSYVGTNDTQVFDYGGFVPGQFFTTVATQCGNLPIAASGTPIGGGTVDIVLPNVGISSIELGFPGSIPLALLFGPSCPCLQGAVNGIIAPNPAQLVIPPTPGFVGITFAAQGVAIGGTSCLGFLDLSDTVQFTIR